MDALRLDLKYAVRALAARPGFALLAVLTLAIGIGVNTVAFSALNALLFKPFRIDGSESLGWIMARGDRGAGLVSWTEFQHLASSNRTFARIAAEGRMPLGLREHGRTGQVWSLLVSSNYLAMLNARPEIGRLFTDADIHGSEIPAIASHRFWVDRLGGGGTVAGRTVTLNGRSASIVGVLPDGFQGPGGLFEPSLWVPLERMDALNIPGGLRTPDRDWLTAIGQLKHTVTPSQAQAELDGLAAGLPAAQAAADKRPFVFESMRDRHPQLRGLAPMMWVALGVVSIVLLVACFNVAGLLLARAAERQTEIGVRCALGAGRGRIFRQLITEGLVLAALSGIASLVVAAWSADLLSAFSLPAPIPQRLHLGIDRRLFAFTIAMVLVAGVLPALVPALQATRADLLGLMRSASVSGGRASRTRNAFIVAQIAGSTLFLGAALLFVRSYWNAATSNPGFGVEHALVLQLHPSTHGYDDSRTRLLAGSLVERLRALPGVQHAAVADRIPFYVGFARTTDVAADGSACATPHCRTAAVYAVGDAHFAALGVPLRSGRDFTVADLQSATGVIISETLARRLWPGERAIGRWLKEGKEGRHVEVIGVAADIKHRNMGEDPGSYLYRPYRPDDLADTMTVVARTHGDPRVMLGAVQEQVFALDPDLPVASVQTMAQRMEMPLWPARTAAGFFLICGVLSVVLATVGLFGVTSYAISQRTREFGIRVALGATSRSVVGLVLREGLWLTLPGVVLGIGGAAIAGRLLSNLLFGVSAVDGLTLATTALLQAGVALLACAVPARRATSADPMTALRAT